MKKHDVRIQPKYIIDLMNKNPRRAATTLSEPTQNRYLCYILDISVWPWIWDSPHYPSSTAISKDFFFIQSSAKLNRVQTTSLKAVIEKIMGFVATAEGKIGRVWPDPFAQCRVNGGVYFLNSIKLSEWRNPGKNALENQ